MKRLCRLLMLLCLSERAGAWTLEPLVRLERPAEPASLSSLARVAENRYLSSTDWNPVLYEITFAFASNGLPQRVHVTRKGAVEGGKDVEGLAFDPLAKQVWVADEGHTAVTAHDPATGKRLCALDVPAVYRQARRTFGLESLTLSPDGKTLYLANEEALSCDGPISTQARGTRVRLTRFTRTDPSAPWQAAGMWAYETDPLEGAAPFDSCRSGLADLCLLGDGTLLALERECSFKPLPALRTRLYAIDRAGADDVTTRKSLAEDSVKPLRKRLVWGGATGLANYEGLAEGPTLKDGTRTLILVSDGGQLAEKSVLFLRFAK